MCSQHSPIDEFSWIKYLYKLHEHLLFLRVAVVPGCLVAPEAVRRADMYVFLSLISSFRPLVPGSWGKIPRFVDSDWCGK